MLIDRRTSICVRLYARPCRFVLLSTVCTLGKSNTLASNPLCVDSLKQDIGKEVCVCVCLFVCVKDSETLCRKEIGKNIHGPGSSQAAPTCPFSEGS